MRIPARTGSLTPLVKDFRKVLVNYAGVDFDFAVASQAKSYDQHLWTEAKAHLLVTMILCVLGVKNQFILDPRQFHWSIQESSENITRNVGLWVHVTCSLTMENESPKHFISVLKS